MIVLEVKFEFTINGGIKETAAAVRDSWHSDKFINIKEESGCDEKEEAVPEEMMPIKNFYTKGILSDNSQHWKHKG